jgi:hypothetical protein
MLKKGKQTQDKKSQYLQKDSSFNIRKLVMRTPTSSSPDRSPDIYKEEKQTKSIGQDVAPKPTPSDLIRTGNEKLEGMIIELNSFDVSTIQRRSDPRMKALTGRINDIIAEIFGRDTDEFDDHVIWSLDTLPITIGGSWYPLPEVREGYQKGIQSAVSKLTSLLAVQKKKLKPVNAEKPVSRAVPETTGNQIIAPKEKVSLVNLRGKIKSRESVFFSHTPHSTGDGQSPQSLAATPKLPIDTQRTPNQEDALNNHLKEEKRKSGGHVDQDSNKATNREKKNVVLLESLEEKLKKLEEETPVFGEAQTSREGISRNRLPGESGEEGVPLSTPMAELNEIVSSESEYAEAFANIESGNEEKGLFPQKDEDWVQVINGEGKLRASFADDGDFLSSGLDIEGDILVIDGDNILCSESSLIEVLDGDTRTEEVRGSAGKHDQVDNIAHGKKGISLEALEQKLRELEEKEATGQELLTDYEKSEDGEVLLIEGTDGLPEEVMSELVGETASQEICEAIFDSEAVLVIDGDVDSQQESVAPVDNLHWDAEVLQGTFLDSIVHEEILVLECDRGLPEDVATELPPGEDPCDNPKEQSNGSEANADEPNAIDISPEQSDEGDALIISLVSHTSLYDNGFCDRDEYTGKTLFLDDLEERLRGCGTLQQGAEDLDQVSFNYFEEIEVNLQESGTGEGAAEKNLVDLTDSNHEQQEGKQAVAFFGYDFLTSASVKKSIIEQAVYITLEHDIALPRLMEIGHTRNDDASLDMEALQGESLEERPIVDCNMEDVVLELSEDAVYGESRLLELETEFISVDWDILWHHEVADNLAENDLCVDQHEDTPDQDFIAGKVYEVHLEQIFIKDLVSLSDHDYETVNKSAIDAFDFEPTLMETVDAMGPNLDEVVLSLTESARLPGGENEDHGKINAFGGALPEEAVIIVSEEFLTNEATQELDEENMIIRMELPEHAADVLEAHLVDEEVVTLSEQVELPQETAENLLNEVILPDTDEPREPVFLKSYLDELETEAMSKELDDQADCAKTMEVLAADSVLAENSTEITENHGMDELTPSERRELGLLENDDVHVTVDQETLPQNAAFELTEERGSLGLLETNSLEDEPLTVEVFEKALKESAGDLIEEAGDDETSRDSILLEALEEMLSNLETGASEESHVQSEILTPQNTPPTKDEEELVIENQKEPPKKAVLIKSTEERINPFAVTEIGKDRAYEKTLRADDLQAQIGELRYRIEDLRTFDIDSIEQRFDPRVRVLGDTVNGTLADIFGRNTPAYWQNALPSLDSLPVVVGGPKLSPEELRDAYRRRINDAISKVNITIGILEAKLSNLENRGAGGQVLYFTPKAPKYPDIQSLR